MGELARLVAAQQALWPAVLAGDRAAIVAARRVVARLRLLYGLHG